MVRLVVQRLTGGHYFACLLVTILCQLSFNGCVQVADSRIDRRTEEADHSQDFIVHGHHGESVYRIRWDRFDSTPPVTFQGAIVRHHPIEPLSAFVLAQGRDYLPANVFFMNHPMLMVQGPISIWRDGKIIHRNSQNGYLAILTIDGYQDLLICNFFASPSAKLQILFRETIEDDMRSSVTTKGSLVIDREDPSLPINLGFAPPLVNNCPVLTVSIKAGEAWHEMARVEADEDGSYHGSVLARAPSSIPIPEQLPVLRK